jgi:hypothetical protein
MKRMVRAGGGSRFAEMSAVSVRAISRFAEQPLALSFAPGFSWSRWQLKTISPADGVVPGMVPTSVSYGCASSLRARTTACSVIVSPRPSRCCNARASRSGIMIANVFRRPRGSRWPQRIRSALSRHQALTWFEL